MTKSIIKPEFWADLGERVLSSAAGGALAIVVASGFDLTSGDDLKALAVGAATAAVVSLLKGLAASGLGDGSASLVK